MLSVFGGVESLEMEEMRGELYRGGASSLGLEDLEHWLGAQRRGGLGARHGAQGGGSVSKTCP